MEFKDGDRVHVTRLNHEEVNFYGTLSDDTGNQQHYLKLTNCSKSKFNNERIYTPKNIHFGKGKSDYYTLATDEEDTEVPEIQYINDKKIVQEYINNTVNHPSHYNYGDIEVIDFIEQVTKHYSSDVAYHIGNAIKYISRAPHKNGKEDIAKAKWYLERAYDKWK